MLNYLDIASIKVDEISKLTFSSDKNEGLKNLIITCLAEGNDQDTIKSKINMNYQKLISEIEENSSIQIITKSKNNDAIIELIEELLFDLKELISIKKIESLENELINNLDESSYSELVKLKSQLNRE